MRLCRAQINSSIDFKPKKLQIILNESLEIAPNNCIKFGNSQVKVRQPRL